MNNSSKTVLGNDLAENLNGDSHSHSHEDQFRHKRRDSMHLPVGLRVGHREGCDDSIARLNQIVLPRKCR